MIRGSRRKALGGDSRSIFLLRFTDKPVKILRFYITQRFCRGAKWKKKGERRRREEKKEKFSSVLFFVARATTMAGEKLNLHIECNQTPTGCLKMVFRAFDRKRRRDAGKQQFEKQKNEKRNIHAFTFLLFFLSIFFASVNGTTWSFQFH